MSSKILKNLENISKDIKVQDINGNLNNLTPGSKWKVMAEGVVKDMPKKMSIEDLAKIVKDGFDNVNLRLDILEKDVSVLKQDVNVLKQDVNVLKSFHKNEFSKLKSQKKNST